MLVFLAVLLSSEAFACSCIPVGVQADKSSSAVVFRGVVTSVEELPARVDFDRARSAVTFAVSEYWKGNPARTIKLHILRPGSDCVGARFDLRTEYVVFATSQKADDYQLGGHVLFGWLDLMAAGTEFLTVDNYCDSTAPIKEARRTLRALGKGKKP